MAKTKSRAEVKFFFASSEIAQAAKDRLRREIRSGQVRVVDRKKKKRP
jgi:hypothetical protein